MYNNINNPQQPYFEARAKELSLMWKVYNDNIFNKQHNYNLHETHPQCDSHDFELQADGAPTVIIDVKNRNYDINFFNQRGFMVEFTKLRKIAETNTYKTHGKAILICSTKDGYYVIHNLSPYIDNIDNIDSVNINANWNTVNNGMTIDKQSVILPVNEAWYIGTYNPFYVFSQQNIKRESDYICQQNYPTGQTTYVKY